MSEARIVKDLNLIFTILKNIFTLKIWSEIAFLFEVLKSYSIYFQK